MRAVLRLASQLTTALPIVMDPVVDPLALAFIKRFARPGGNITGTTFAGATMYVKSVKLLKTVLPKLSRLEILGDPSNPVNTSNAMFAPSVQSARALGLHTLEVDVRVEDVDRAFVDAGAWRAEALLLTQPTYTAGVNARVVELSARHALPAMYHFGPNVTENGGLMSLTPNFRPLNQHGYVDTILRGASAADLPGSSISSSTSRQLEMLGITFPPDGAAQVTQWVQ
jgi:putative tryptophan/tyrosine transport system substrate-binding protein